MSADVSTSSARSSATCHKAILYNNRMRKCRGSKEHQNCKGKSISSFANRTVRNALRSALFAESKSKVKCVIVAASKKKVCKVRSFSAKCSVRRKHEEMFAK